MSRIINFDVAAFRALFPAYANATTYPEATLQAFWNSAILYINNYYGSCYLGAMSLGQQTQAINLMTAHLVYLSALIAAGETPGVLTSATIDKISVTLEPPPAKNAWQYWLQTSPYGQQLLALLQVAGAGGFYIGGVPALTAFRNGFGFRR